MPTKGTFTSQPVAAYSRLLPWVFGETQFLGVFIYLFIFIYSTANDGRLEPGMPSASTSCDNVMAKC